MKKTTLFAFLLTMLLVSCTSNSEVETIESEVIDSVETVEETALIDTNSVAVDSLAIDTNVVEEVK